MKALLPKLAAAIALGAFALGVGVGCYVSDQAAVAGVPHKRYLVTLKHDASPEANFFCAKLGANLGGNYSHFDKQAHVQTDCILGLTGEVLPDGSFSADFAPLLWSGRLGLLGSFHIEAARIQAITTL